MMSRLNKQQTITTKIDTIMTDTLASWITLSALIASAAWYLTREQDRSLNTIVMCVLSGVLCLFGGFLFSGAIMKLTGSFENALIPALLVCLGTALCTVTHSLYRTKRAANS